MELRFSRYPFGRVRTCWRDASRTLATLSLAWLSYAAPSQGAAMITGASSAGQQAQHNRDPNPTDEATQSTSGATRSTSTGTRVSITHTVVPYETLSEIGERYGVTEKELRGWNQVLRGGKLNAGWKLRVRARIPAPPREKIVYTVKFGDTWAEIATRFNVGVTQLRRWNPKVPRQFKAGATLTVYTNPKARRVLSVNQSSRVQAGTLEIPGEEQLDIPGGGYSVGKPNRGRLVGGVQLPTSELYTVRRPGETWGSSHAIAQFQRAISAFRAETGFDGELLVGAMSLQHGGRFRPHHSHQSGRDIDLRLPRRRGADPKSTAASDIDWEAAWQLIRSFSATGEVEYIFLDYRRQELLRRAAKSTGASADEIDRVIQYPRGRSANHGLVRHSDGHVIHIHIRIKCARDNPRCES